MLKNSEKAPAREDASKKLSANLMRIRAKILKTVQDETLDDALSVLKERYSVEKDVDIPPGNNGGAVLDHSAKICPYWVG